MRRRTILLGLGAATGTGAALGSGAFSTASADREVNITVADDANSFLSLIPGEESGEYTDASGDALVLDISGDDGVGVGVDTEYTFDGLVEIANNGQDSTFVWTTVGSAAFGDDQLFIYTDDPETPLSDANAVELDAGESVSVGLYIDTTGLESDQYSPTLTIEAADEDPDAEGPGEEPDPPAETIPSVLLDSVSSLLNENQEPLTDDSIVPIRAEPAAGNTDADGNGDAVSYPDDIDIPVVAVDGGVVGVTGPFVATNTNFSEYGNEEFLLNLYDRLIGGTGTVLHDEGHGQFYTLAPNGGDDFQAFGGYAEDNGYTYEATGDIEADLSGADAVVITSPSDGFTDGERDALSGFVDDGGVVFLHDQSDYNNFDATDNLNDIASDLGVGFRFNDDQVIDEQNNTGAPFVPTTANFNTAAFPALFADREGLGIELDPNEEYEVEVVSVADGDTADVQFDTGEVDTVRILGIDTPETGDTEERLQEYEGIDDGPALKAKADEATSYAEDKLGVGTTVTLSFDENEELRGNFGRLLGFLELPDDGGVYNAKAIENGWARVYDSGLANHDEYWDLERAARDDDKGIWGISDVESTSVVGDGPVDELFVPFASSVATADGDIATDRVPVSTEGGDPLVGVDESNNVALVGGPLPAESFESGEGGPGTEPYGNYVFLANLIDSLAADGREGSVVIDGGHGQFAADYALSAEDAAYFQRYLEGFAIEFDGKNDFDDDLGRDLAEARAVIVTAPDTELGSEEVAAIEDFRDDGGAVILAGAGADDAADARDNLDALAGALGSDLRTGDAVTDEENNLGGKSNPTTTNFDDDFPALFESFGDGNAPSGGALEVVEVTADAEGVDLEDPQENVVFENTGDDALDLTDYAVSDETSKEYVFSDGFTLQSGEQVTLYSGTGSDTDTELYWGQTGGAVWNNGGDTVFVTDAGGTTVVEYSY